MSNVKQIMKKPITIENSASLFKAMAPKVILAHIGTFTPRTFLKMISP